MHAWATQNQRTILRSLKNHYPLESAIRPSHNQPRATRVSIHLTNTDHISTDLTHTDHIDQANIDPISLWSMLVRLGLET